MFRPPWDELDLEARLSRYYDYDHQRSRSPGQYHLDRMREIEEEIMYRRSHSRRSHSPRHRHKSRSPRRKRDDKRDDKPAKSLVPYDRSPSPTRIVSYGKHSLNNKRTADKRAPLTRDMCSDDVPGGRKTAKLPFMEPRGPLLPPPPLPLDPPLRRSHYSDLPPMPSFGYDDPYDPYQHLPPSLRPPVRDRPLLGDPYRHDGFLEEKPLGVRVPPASEEDRLLRERESDIHSNMYDTGRENTDSELPFTGMYDFTDDGDEEEEEAIGDAKTIEISKSRGLYCLICEAAATSIDQYQKHLQGTRHKKMLKKLGLKDELGTCSEAAAEVSESSPTIIDTKFQEGSNEIINVVQCVVCKMKCPADALGPHIANRVHVAAENEWQKVGRMVPKFKDMFEETGEKLECLDTVRLPDAPKVFSSDIHVCKVCNITATCYETLQQHLQGKKHAKMLRQAEGTHSVGGFYCEVCNIHTNSAEGLKQHRAGRRHANNSQPYQLSTIDTSIN